LKGSQFSYLSDPAAKVKTVIKEEIIVVPAALQSFCESLEPPSTILINFET